MNKLPPQDKKLKIQTNCLKRYQKDYMSYKKEAENEKKRLDKYKSENKGINDLKKQQEIIAECEQMFPVIKKKIIMQNEVVMKLLDEFIATNKDYSGKQIGETKAILEQVKDFIDSELNN